VSDPKPTRPTIDEIIAAPDADRMDLVRAFTRPVFDDARARRERGVCGECDAPIAGGDGYGDTYCATHAREIEIDHLKFQQEHCADDD